MLPAHHLRHVLALGEHRHYARAAEALHITQPALTRSIQALEALLDARLFDRGRGAVVPTAIGRLLLDYARDVDLGARDLRRAVALAQGAQLGRLVVVAGPFAGAALAGPVVGRLCRAHPGLHIEVVIAPWQKLPQRLRAREIDLMLADLSEAAAMDDLALTRLPPHAAVLVARAGHPLAVQPPAAAAHWRTYPWAGPRMPASAARRLARHLPAAGDAAAPPGIVCDSHAVLQDVLLASDAVAPVCAFMVADALRSGRLVVLPTPPLGDYGRFGVARLAARSTGAAEEVFVRLLKTVDAELRAEEAALLTPAPALKSSSPPRRRSPRSAPAGRPAS